MANDEHLAKLKEGVEVWNAWRAAEQIQTPDLSGAHLALIDLSGGVNLINADLKGANLLKAKLSEAKLLTADLSGADLEGADFREADLAGSGPQFSANLQGANLRRANLRNAKLDDANLEGTILLEADLRGASIRGVNLSNSVLTDVRHLLLDGNPIRDATFSPFARDPWSSLRRRYTGPLLLFNVLFLIAFIVPYVLKAIFWVSVNRAQEKLLSVSTIANGHTPCLAELCVPYQVWQLLVGFDKEWWFAALTVSLILYNVLRGVLTYRVGVLRDQEERICVTPYWKDYKWLARADWVMKVLVLVAIVSFAFHAYYWLGATVYLPASPTP